MVGSTYGRFCIKFPHLVQIGKKHGHNGNVLFLIDCLIYLCLTSLSSNISAISWRPVLVVEEGGVLGENHRPWAIQATGKLYHLWLQKR
jgi:hypothetical protein